MVLSTPPTSAGPLTAVVTTNGASSGPVQVATPSPVVTSSTASLASDATTLTIGGHGFDPTAGNDSVTFSDGSTTPVGNGDGGDAYFAHRDVQHAAGGNRAVDGRGDDRRRERFVRASRRRSLRR